MLHPVNGGPNFTSAYGSCSGECAGKGCAIGCAFATLTSADGVHFTHKSNSGEMGDRSSFFWDSFRKKWVYSIRTTECGRSRNYWESDNFTNCSWPSTKAGVEQGHMGGLPWTAGVDSLDDQLVGTTTIQRADLYNIDAVRYESLTLMMISVHWLECRRGGVAHPECTALYVGFSRDGWHISRSEPAPGTHTRAPFAPWSPHAGMWHYGDIQSVAGGFLPADNGSSLRFFVSGRSSSVKNGSVVAHTDGLGFTGVGRLRRDG